MTKQKQRPIVALAAHQKKPKDAVFCDTSIIFYKLHSHPLIRAEVLRLQGDKGLLLSNFARGEYVKGYIFGLLVLYTTIRTENHVEQGMQIFRAEHGHQSRRIADAFEATAIFLMGHDNSGDVDATLERLGEMVRNCLFRLDEEFPRRQLDETACDFGVLNFPQATFSEDHILDLYQQIQNAREEPTCSQCDFRDKYVAQHEETGVDLYSEAQQEKYSDFKAYVAQAKKMDQAVRSELDGPSCWYCDALGDTILALQCPANAYIFTGDRSSYPALADILKKETLDVPSLVKLKAIRDAAKPKPKT